MQTAKHSYKTADLYDNYGAELQVCEPVFTHFGGLSTFSGPVETVQCLEDNSEVKKILSEAGDGRILVVHGGGSLHCALLGDMIAQQAVDQGWSGVVIYGCVRDSEELSNMSLGVLALATTPRKSVRQGQGILNIPVCFAGVVINPGDWLYADPDGVLIAKRRLDVPENDISQDSVCG